MGSAGVFCVLEERLRAAPAALSPEEKRRRAKLAKGPGEVTKV
jgi:hypothetical protein